MEKRSFILTALLPVLCFSMVACGKSSDSKPSSKDKPSLIAKSQEAAPHQDKRLAFENIHIASADQEFKGGSSIEI
ncbi:lipoprotein [Streptococcus pseudoporcinus]|uniref:Lipoprotein n=1 Tax=Streptococcus pseudoporcinus TaxID=361101 RepID=A0A4U9Y8F9_9STRE|nr:lipoprotein [Streptococcus pseudoporcinus]